MWSSCTQNAVFMTLDLPTPIFFAMFVLFMTLTMKRIVLILALCAGLVSAAQAQVSDMMNRLRTATIRTSVVDGKTGEPLSYAAVCLTPQGDTTITAFGLSGDDGKVSIENVQQGRYTLSVVMVGYKEFSKALDLRLGEFERERNLGQIALEMDAEFLEAAQVSATGNRVITKKDTLVYNASAYKVVENAMLVDLLKKLPGVKVGNSGSITVNGESVTKITVDGKTFFTKDPSLAVKNLPAKIVNQIQVIDRPKEDAAFTGVATKDEQEKVMDIKLKEEFQKGWFGNAKLSGGTSLIKQDDAAHYGQGKALFNGNAMVSRFTQKDQIVFLGSGKNANEPGSWSMGDEGGEMFMPGADMDEMAMKPGLETNAQTGVNINTTRLKGLESNISTSYNFKKKNVYEKSFRTSYQSGADDVLTNSLTTGRAMDHSVSSSLEFLNVDKGKYLFVLRPFIMFSNQDRASQSSSDSKTGGSAMNSSTSDVRSRTNVLSNFIELELGVKDIGKTGRSLTFTSEAMLDNSKGIKSELSQTKYQDNMEIRNLNYDVRMFTVSPELELNYVEPLSRNWSMQARVAGGYGYSKTVKDARSGEDGSENLYYSSLSSNKDYRIRERMLMQYRKDDNTLLFGFQFDEQQNITRAKYMGQDNTVGKGVWIFNWSPYVDFTRKTDSSTLRFEYRGNPMNPSGKNIIPTLDLTNPVQISAGNIYLRPQFTHTGYVNFRSSNTKNYSIVEVYLNGSLNTNQIVSASWFDDNGLRYSVPVNSRKPGGNISTFASFSMPFGKQKNFTITLDGDLGLDFNTSYQSLTRRPSIDMENFDYDALMSDIWGDKDGGRFYGGESGFGQSSTNTLSFSVFPTLDYRLDNFTVRLLGFATGRFSRYSLDKSANMNTWDFNVSTELLYSTKRGWQFNTDAGYSFYKGYAQGFGRPELIWNAGVAKDIKAFTLSFKVADILNQQKSLSRVTSAEYMEDVQRNVMARYFLVGVSFNFGKMNATQSGKVERALWEMSF